MCLILKVYSVQNQNFGYKIYFSRQKHSFLEIKKAKKGEAMKNVRSKSVQSRYFILSVVLILCMLIGMINGVPFLSQASGHEEQLASKNVMAKITLDGKNPPAGKFQFELVDSNGSVVDRTTNDAGGNIIFKGHELEVKEAKYTIRLVDGDKNINYGETTKNVNVYLKDGEEIVDPYDGATNFRATADGNGLITVSYNLNGKTKTTKAYCINTDKGLDSNATMIPIKDPDDATLAKYIVPKFYDWQAKYNQAKTYGTKQEIIPGFTLWTIVTGIHKFIRYDYFPKTNSIVSEIKSDYNVNSISELLRKTLYYADFNFNAADVKVDRFRGGKNAYGFSVESYAEKYLREGRDEIVKQNMIWAVTGGLWGTKRIHYRYDGAVKDGRPVEQMEPDEQYTLTPANFKSHMQKIAKQNFNIPDNYHVMIFANAGNTSQPFAFGYFNDEEKS